MTNSSLLAIITELEDLANDLHKEQKWLYHAKVERIKRKLCNEFMEPLNPKESDIRYD